MLYSNVAVATAHLTVDTTWCMDLHQRWSACKYKLQLGGAVVSDRVCWQSATSVPEALEFEGGQH